MTSRLRHRVFRPRGVSYRMASIAASALFVVAGLPMSVGAAAPVIVLPAGARDITATALGSQLAEQAQLRLAANGITTELRVVEDDGGYTVAPTDTEFVAVPMTLADGREGTAAMPVTGRQSVRNAGLFGSIQTAAAASPSWAWQQGSCFSRINHTFAYIDHCYQIYKMTNDNSSTLDYFALKHYGTAGPNSPWTLGYAYIHSYRLSGTTAQSWLDWDPNGSWQGGCSTVTLNVTWQAVGLNLNVSRCEQWDVVKQNPAVDLKETWLNPGTRSTRGLGMELAVSVTQGAWPQWVIPADADGGVV